MTDLGEIYLSWHHNGLSLINCVWSGTALALTSVFDVGVVKDLISTTPATCRGKAAFSQESKSKNK